MNRRLCRIFLAHYLEFSLFVFTFASPVFAQDKKAATSDSSVPKSTALQIMSAEDQRRWDETLAKLFTDSRAAVRARVALAAGRIGDDGAVTALSALLKDQDEKVRAMAAFAIGEIESPKGADVLVNLLRDTAVSGEVRARAVEGLGKIAAALPREQEPRMRELGAVILETLRSEGNRTSESNGQTILLALTAALRSRPENAGTVIATFLRHPDPRIRADAANALARLRSKDGNEQVLEMVKGDVDPVVRANAARVLGATEDKRAYDSLLDRSIRDNDSRVRVSAIRAMASLKDARAGDTLFKRAAELLGTLRKQKAQDAQPAVQNELLEIVTTLGRLVPLQSSAGPPDKRVIESFFLNVRELMDPWAPEVELAFVRILPNEYVEEMNKRTRMKAPHPLHWRTVASAAQALGETASLPDTVPNKSGLVTKAETLVRAILDQSSNVTRTNVPHTENAIPDLLRSLAAHKPKDLAELLRKYLNDADVVVRGTAADLLGDLPPSEENANALIAALPRALRDELNDAVLSILDSLGKQKTAAANDAIKSLLDSKDHLVRRRAVALLKANSAGDFSARIGPVETSNTRVDYERALSRTGSRWRAIVTTTKGSFTIELLPSDAPLTVDNFVRLAQRGYFAGVTIHRVVPNFVIQDGDPRGDGNGGPGYQIRCEINQVPYERAAVGMALSGKDTGGSQWFVTHAPQPHLDGGYTVFGRVIAGMEVVDTIVRGDKIRSVTIRRG